MDEIEGFNSLDLIHMLVLKCYSLTQALGPTHPTDAARFRCRAISRAIPSSGCQAYQGFIRLATVGFGH